MSTNHTNASPHDNGSSAQELVFAALDSFRIEVPSWGFANTGTRFGKFVQAAAATTIEEKFADAAEVNRLTGAVPTVALHVLWDMPGGVADSAKINALVKKYGVKAGSINPNLFQDQQYKFGSIANPSAEIRKMALDHLLDCVEIGKELNSPDVSCWIADGSNYPGTQSMRRRISYMEEIFATMHGALADWQRILIVDTGHHYQGTNIEQIVTWLLSAKALGGFHFNDRKYADDDLTLGSIDPYQLFRIFHEILSVSEQERSGIAYMIDQSHNMKGKMEAMVQSVVTAQELYARAALVDHARLSELQDACLLVEAEETFRSAFWTDVRPLVRDWREARGLPAEPLKELATSGYMEKITAERGAKNSNAVSSYA
jgi:L-rhamnose isomerase/sugar isomerase